jgi:acyl carrier protein
MPHDDVEQKIKQIMADIFHTDPQRIGDQTSMDNTEHWDSANHISLVLALEEEFSIAFDVAEIETMTSFPDVIEAVTARIDVSH